MSYENILVDRDRPTAVITLNRPKALNALNPTLMAELIDALRKLDQDDDVRALVLTVARRCSRPGLTSRTWRTDPRWISCWGDYTGSWARVTSFSKPLIAAVSGYALGGGCELALMCDLIVAGDSARFGQPEINLGVIPGAGARSDGHTASASTLR